METAIFLSVLAVLVTGRLYLGHLALEAFESMPDEAKRRFMEARRWGGSY